MAKKVALCVLLFGMTSVASAGGLILTDLCKDVKQLDHTKPCQEALGKASKAVAAPEIDPSSALAGMTLLLGGVAVVRGRRA
jgi:hypothetical protein